MLEAAWCEWTAWWAEVTPAFAFLMAVPVLVAVVALAGDWARATRRKP